MASRRAAAHLLLLQRRDAPPQLLQRLDRLHRRLRLRGSLLRRRVRLAQRRLGRPLARPAFGCRPRQLLPQLAALALQRGPLTLERTERLGAPLQLLLQLPHQPALRHQPLPHRLLQRRAAR